MREREPQEPPETAEDDMIDTLLTALPFLRLLRDAAQYDSAGERIHINGRMVDLPALRKLVAHIETQLPETMYDWYARG